MGVTRRHISETKTLIQVAFGVDGTIIIFFILRIYDGGHTHLVVIVHFFYVDF